ncbi:MAG: DNA mismatch repair endonuclease MutL, partial [Oscillospiraceae bacterium]|nr:DNA mismatch repair endonuclease MutL [Oscillospiraceae bacterium]
VLRHSTSKIKTEADLEKIQTLGFRGEALAAISSVTDLKIFTKTRRNGTGYLLESSSGQNTGISEAGCPDGTTVITERMFSKIPARQKFLKRDATEGMYCKWVIEKTAVANPGISFKFIQDGKQKIFTPGNGSLWDAVYSVFGGEVADGLICVEDSKNDGNYITVSGYISKIGNMRKNRSEENFFVNGRYVCSKTVTAALEEAYKSTADTGGFPFCVLNITIDEAHIDVNVHPQKTEIKFSDEKKVYSAVYYAVKNALESDGGFEAYKYEHEQKQTADIVRGSAGTAGFVPAGSAAEPDISFFDEYKYSEKVYDLNQFNAAAEVKEPGFENYKNYKLIGEAFYGHILLEKNEKIVIIDKHAAHERIIYDMILKKAADNKKNAQLLLVPVEITLTARETAGILNIEQDLKKIGFAFGWQEDNIAVAEVPGELADLDIAGFIKEAAHMGAEETEGNIYAFESLAELAANKYAACRAAMKSGLRDSTEDIVWLADRVINYEDVKYCPHGRPVAFEIPKEEIEKRFKR